MHRQTLQLKEKVLGVEHPQTLMSIKANRYFSNSTITGTEKAILVFVAVSMTDERMTEKT